MVKEDSAQNQVFSPKSGASVGFLPSDDTSAHPLDDSHREMDYSARFCFLGRTTLPAAVPDYDDALLAELDWVVGSVHT